MNPEADTNPELMRTRVLIVGGGLSGLHCAYELAREGIDFILIEARERLGGRILSVGVDGEFSDGTQTGFDLGPAWFWPGQTRMEQLVRDLDLVDAVFTQYGTGDSLYEDDKGLHRGVPGFFNGRLLSIERRDATDYFEACAATTARTFAASCEVISA